MRFIHRKQLTIKQNTNRSRRSSKVRFGEHPRSELATASLRPGWHYTRGPSRTGVARATQSQRFGSSAGLARCSRPATRNSALLGVHALDGQRASDRDHHLVTFHRR
jgi:hypothetical protein